jgi:hypothetical protein
MLVFISGDFHKFSPTLSKQFAASANRWFTFYGCKVNVSSARGTKPLSVVAMPHLQSQVGRQLESIAEAQY